MEENPWITMWQPLFTVICWYCLVCYSDYHSWNQSILSLSKHQNNKLTHPTRDLSYLLVGSSVTHEQWTFKGGVGDFLVYLYNFSCSSINTVFSF